MNHIRVVIFTITPLNVIRNIVKFLSLQLLMDIGFSKVVYMVLIGLSKKSWRFSFSNEYLGIKYTS